MFMISRPFMGLLPDGGVLIQSDSRTTWVKCELRDDTRLTAAGGRLRGGWLPVTMGFVDPHRAGLDRFHSKKECTRLRFGLVLVSVSNHFLDIVSSRFNRTLAAMVQAAASFGLVPAGSSGS